MAKRAGKGTSGSGKQSAINGFPKRRSGRKFLRKRNYPRVEAYQKAHKSRRRFR